MTEDQQRVRQLIEDTAYAVTNHARRTSPPSATQTWRSFTQILDRFATDVFAIGYNAGYAEGMRVEREQEQQLELPLGHGARDLWIGTEDFT